MWNFWEVALARALYSGLNICIGDVTDTLQLYKGTYPSTEYYSPS
jgi:hypothetical protein